MHGIIAELFSQLTKDLCAYLGQALPKLELEHLKVQAQLMRVRMVFCDQLPETRKYRAALCGFKACP